MELKDEGLTLKDINAWLRSGVPLQGDMNPEINRQITSNG